MSIQTDKRVINYIKKRISQSHNIVVVVGLEMLLEGGGLDLDSNPEHYRLEEEYGYGMEEMFSTSFFNAKVDKFYRFYINEILSMKINSTPAYDALMKLQNQGRLKTIINQNFHSVPEKFHFKNVIDLNGNLNINLCPRCNKRFNVGQIMKTKGVLLCDDCKAPIRPSIRLIGERVDTKLMTEVATACEMADVLLILGRNIYNDRLEYMTTQEHEQLKVLFSKDETTINDKVNFIIRDDICEFLPLIID